VIHPKVMQATTDDLHENHAHSYEEFVCYLYRLLRMMCTKVMQIATNDSHDIHENSYEEFV
jgi:hypothetical protein